MPALQTRSHHAIVRRLVFSFYTRLDIVHHAMSSMTWRIDSIPEGSWSPFRALDTVRPDPLLLVTTPRFGC